MRGEVTLYEALADIPFPVGAGVATAATDSPCVEDDRHASRIIQRGEHVLHPAPVGGGGRRNAEGEAVVGIVLVGGEGEVLVPHGIGRDQVEAAQVGAVV